MNGVGPLDMVSLLFGVAWIVMTLWMFTIPPGFAAGSSSRRNDWLAHCLGVAFGVAWTGASIAHRGTDATWWLGATAAVLISVLTILQLVTTARPESLLKPSMRNPSRH
ncbi:MAG: hypothetical protein NVS4B2_32690 [Chloroflexota bacterium]